VRRALDAFLRELDAMSLAETLAAPSAAASLLRIKAA
jgi:hypothetical protein